MNKDISERDTELFRLVVENVRDFAVYMNDMEGRILSWNPGVERLLGYTESEWVGRNVSLIFPPEDIARGAVEWELRTAREHGRAEDKRWHVRKDGTRFWANGMLMLMRDGDGAARCYAKIMRDDSTRKRMEDELRHSKEELEGRVTERTGDLLSVSETLLAEIKVRQAGEERGRMLLRRVVDAQELERARIARDLHDSIGQELTALRLKLDVLKKSCGEQAELCEGIDEVQEIARRVESELDFIAWELRPAVLDRLGLRAASELFVNEWSRHYGIPGDFQCLMADGLRLKPEAETSLYRILQEALNNVYKHSGANLAEVLLDSRADSLVLIVADDGEGFEPGVAADGERGMGLLSMKERAEQVGGTLEIESAPGSGTTVYARVPLGLMQAAGAI